MDRVVPHGRAAGQPCPHDQPRGDADPDLALGLVLNPGQMADLVLAWRQVAGLIAAIPQGRPLADDAALEFPAAAAGRRRPPASGGAGGQGGGESGVQDRRRSRGTAARRPRRPAPKAASRPARRPSGLAPRPSGSHAMAKPKPARASKAAHRGQGDSRAHARSVPSRARRGKATPHRSAAGGRHTPPPEQGQAAVARRIAARAEIQDQADTTSDTPSRLRRAMKGGVPPFPPSPRPAA